MPHSYRITSKSLAEILPGDAAQSLVFDVVNHDDILQLVERVRASAILPDEEAAAFVVGLKLLSEVMLKHRAGPLFADLFPQFGLFMKRLKDTASPRG